MILPNRTIFHLIFLFFGILFSQNIQIPDAPVIVDINHIAKKVDIKQLTCLAKNIYYEAGHETIQGQAAVARVVMNRIKHGFAKNPCQVVYQTYNIEKTDINGNTVLIKLCQFSWVCEKTKNVINKNRYKQAEQVAYDVMVDDKYSEVLPSNALFFHNIEVDPLWPYKQVAKIGNHIFYAQRNKKD
jgi:N-acetylmuramoyl-L-alanine amidase